MNKYSLIQSNMNDRTYYGVTIETENDGIYEYGYISAFRSEADELIRQMSQDYISPAHFNDIVTDYLARLFYKKLSLNGLSQTEKY